MLTGTFVDGSRSLEGRSSGQSEDLRSLVSREIKRVPARRTTGPWLGMGGAKGKARSLCKDHAEDNGDRLALAVAVEGEGHLTKAKYSM